MAPTSAQTLFGFGSGLDWRPTSFVNAFPATAVCSACGLVPPSLAILPCRHLLCQRCYDRDGCKSNRCPLDKELFREEDVLWSTFSNDSVLNRKVRCWNANNGCNAENVASAMLEHFTNACQFHVVSCPRCGDKLLHRDAAKHRENSCTPSYDRYLPRGDNFPNSSAELHEALRAISKAMDSLYARLESFEQRLNTDRQALTVTRLSALQTTIESLQQCFCAERERDMNALSPIVARAVAVTLENANATCQLQFKATLAEHRLEVASQISDLLAENKRCIEFFTHECNRMKLALEHGAATLLTGQQSETCSASSADPASCALLFDISDRISMLQEQMSMSATVSGKVLAEVKQLLALAYVAVRNNTSNVSQPCECTCGWQSWYASV